MFVAKYVINKYNLADVNNEPILTAKILIFQ